MFDKHTNPYPYYNSASDPWGTFTITEDGEPRPFHDPEEVERQLRQAALSYLGREGLRIASHSLLSLGKATLEYLDQATKPE